MDNIVLDNYLDAAVKMSEGMKKGSKKEKGLPVLDKEITDPGKKQRVDNNSSISEGPIGLRWDAKTGSCAYDAFFTILHHIWTETVDGTYTMLSRYNKY